ncbi:MAG: hypothetical protein CL506_03095 [Actinobacteria bacterium]|nr:hypothetical protein [Actinomycetota bacterium]|tara:strand:- start:2295 stop:2885 length:591 start_codon:yes stop_codon:yes gene_type:complete
MLNLKHFIEKLSLMFENQSIQIPDSKSKLASVFLLFEEKEEDFFIILLKRSLQVQFHGGEICLPGGTLESTDRDLLTTAFREVEEEIGVPKNKISRISTLDFEDTRTGFTIRPFVGLLEDNVELTIDGTEIVNILSISINDLIKGSNLRTLWFLDVDQNLYSKPAFIIDGEVAWGATANIIVNFFKKIGYKINQYG